MKDLPHHYVVSAAAGPDSPIRLSSGALPVLSSQPPAQFGGPGDQWSPEDLLVAAVADCFVLTFRAIARMSKLSWSALECSAEGVLDRDQHQLKFTELRVRAHLRISNAGDEERAERLLEKAERGCLVTNSMTASVKLEVHVTVAG